ncbi:MAG: ferritin family protein [Nitrospirota bacterium]
MNAIEIAIKMETDAINFYKEASKKANHSVGKKMFLTIAEDEKRHLDMLNQILKGLDIKIKDVSPMKNIKTVFEEIKDEMMHKVEATTDELEAFKIAIRMEKEGIEFYKKAASGAKTDKEKSLFERLIKEEQQHYDIFANTYFFLSDTGNWFMWEEHSIVDGGTPWA